MQDLLKNPNTLYMMLGVGMVLTYLAFSALRKGPEDIEGQVQEIQKSYKPFLGVIRSWFLRKRSEARTKLLTQQLTEISSAISLASSTYTARIAMETAQYQLAENPRRLARQTKIEEAMHQHALKLIRDAEKRMISLVGLEQMMMAREANSQAIRIKEAESRIRTSEQRDMKDIEVMGELQKVLNTLDAILRYKNIKYAEFDFLLGKGLELIAKREKAMKQGATWDQLEMINKALNTYMGLFNDQINRLSLEARNGEDIGAVSNADSLFARAKQISGSTVKESAPLKKPRGKW